MDHELRQAAAEPRGDAEVKLDGETLSGAIVGRDGKENPIQNATYKDGAIAFKLVRERNGATMTMTYTGQLSGDTIKGKIESELNGKSRSRDWEAKRAKD